MAEQWNKSKRKRTRTWYTHFWHFFKQRSYKTWDELMGGMSFHIWQSFLCLSSTGWQISRKRFVCILQNWWSIINQLMYRWDVSIRERYQIFDIQHVYKPKICSGSGSWTGDRHTLRLRLKCLLRIFPRKDMVQFD